MNSLNKADGSHPDLEREQLRRLNLLLQVVRIRNGFQTERLDGSGVWGRVASLQEFFEKFPFTTKAQIAADHEKHPPYGSNLSEPVAVYTRFCQTSGSTGKPLRWIDTAESWQWMVDNWKHVYLNAGVRAEDRVYFAFSFGPFLGFWTAFDAAQQIGCLCVPGGGLSSVGRLQAMIDN